MREVRPRSASDLRPEAPLRNQLNRERVRASLEPSVALGDESHHALRMRVESGLAGGSVGCPMAAVLVPADCRARASGPLPSVIAAFSAAIAAGVSLGGASTGRDSATSGAPACEPAREAVDARFLRAIVGYERWRTTRDAVSQDSLPSILEPGKSHPARS